MIHLNGSKYLSLWLLITCYVLIQGNYCMQLWAALFMAFSIHLLLHIIQAIILRCYVPGLFTSLLLIPYSYLGIQSIWCAMSGVELLSWSLAGVLFMIINLIVAHWIGKKVWQTLHWKGYWMIGSQDEIVKLLFLGDSHSRSNFAWIRIIYHLELSDLAI